ncbi:MAG: PTS glucose transporter subunit IIA [Aerococcus sp.]|nr:PTS glucose transporter subunit IIA [Aerococcus sp.]
MLDFLKRHEESKEVMPVELYAPVDGQLIPITAVNDEAFSHKMIGDGFAVNPTDQKVYSPISGTVLCVFPKQHAIMLKTSFGLEVMVHMGLHTVELDGQPFTIHVQENQEVQHGTLLAEMDYEMIQTAEKDPVVIVCVTSMDRVEALSVIDPVRVTASEVVGHVDVEMLSDDEE